MGLYAVSQADPVFRHLQVTVANFFRGRPLCARNRFVGVAALQFRPLRRREFLIHEFCRLAQPGGETPGHVFGSAHMNVLSARSEYITRSHASTMATNMPVTNLRSRIIS